MASIKLANVQIESEPDSAITKIYINGEEIKNVTAFAFKQEAGKLPVLTLEMLSDSLNFKGKVKVRFLNKKVYENI